jgi:hypothetical protein
MGGSDDARPACPISREVYFAEELHYAQRQRPAVGDPESGKGGIGCSRFCAAPSENRGEQTGGVKQADQIGFLGVYVGQVFGDELCILCDLPGMRPGCRYGMAAAVPSDGLRRHCLEARVQAEIGDAILDSNGTAVTVAVFPPGEPQYLERGAEVSEDQLRDLAEVDAGLLNLKFQEQKGFRQHGEMGKLMDKLDLERLAFDRWLEDCRDLESGILQHCAITWHSYRQVTPISLPQRADLLLQKPGMPSSFGYRCGFEAKEHVDHPAFS